MLWFPSKSLWFILSFSFLQTGIIKAVWEPGTVWFVSGAQWVKHSALFWWSWPLSLRLDGMVVQCPRLACKWSGLNKICEFHSPDQRTHVLLREWLVSGSTGGWKVWKQAAHKPMRWDVFALLIPRKPLSPRNNHDIASSLFTVIFLN